MVEKSTGFPVFLLTRGSFRKDMRKVIVVSWHQVNGKAPGRQNCILSIQFSSSKWLHYIVLSPILTYGALTVKDASLTGEV
jgi:hypothetical protein